MAYFPHAYLKVLSGTNATSFYDGDGTTGINGSVLTTALGAGQIGIISAKNNVVADLDGTPTYANYPMIYLAQGSFHATDKLGPYHGGYKETVKTKGINPKYVSAFYVTQPTNPVNEVMNISYSYASTCQIACNKTYRLRLDIKGSPALRFLTHNAYFTLDANTGCCDGSNPIDPAFVMLQWAERIATYNTLKDFVSPIVWNRVKVSGTAATATATAASALTMTRDGIYANDKVIFTPTTATSATGSTISGNTFTVGTATNTVFSVGQTITGTGVAAGTVITALVSGGGGTGSVFTVNISQTVSSTTISSTSPVTAFVSSSYTNTTGSGAVALVAATNLYTPSATTMDVVTTTTITPAVYHKVNTSLANGTYMYDATLNPSGYSPIASASVAAANPESFLELAVAYVDTQFGNASFLPTDHFELQPLELYASLLDSENNVCTTSCFSVTEKQQGLQGRGYGESLVRDLILAKRYQQEPFQADPRLREVLNDTTLSYIDAAGNVVAGEISRASKYYVYHILHSVPRKSNPSGMLDSDQYLVKIVVSARTGNAAKFETWMNTLLTSAGSEVQLQVLA
jgi:hypothetical protein